MTIKKKSFQELYIVFGMPKRRHKNKNKLTAAPEEPTNSNRKVFFLGLDSCRLYFIFFPLFLILIALWFSGERTPHFHSLFTGSCSA